MCFSRNGISPYQDPVKADNLNVGDICYLVGAGSDMPTIHTFIFIGKNLEASDSDDEVLYFQDSISYYADIRYGNKGSSSPFPATFFHQKADSLNGFYGLKGAAEILMYYSLTRGA